MILVRNEQELAALATRLMGRRDAPRPAEGARSLRLDDLRAAIRAGLDPLGAEFIRLRSPEARRAQGSVFTPPAIVEAMVEWAKAEPGAPPARIVDPGSGSGRFLLSAARAFPRAELVAVEIDPLAALLLRANAAVAGFSGRLTVHVGDYRAARLAPIAGRTLFIGNPPYVRHHRLSAEAKSWFAEAAAQFGIRASKLAGLHVHFFLRTREIARRGDFGAFITSSEWIDVNYGAALRSLLADGLGGTALHILHPAAEPFEDALTTGAIACFRVGNRPAALTIRSVRSVEALRPLSKGRAVPWAAAKKADRWSSLLRPRRRSVSGAMPLGELFRVHRGQVTGNNAVWIAGPEARGLPARFLFPAVTRARELLELEGDALRRDDHLRRVIDLPLELDRLSASERRNVETFLAWARSQGADSSFIATHRRVWWSVGLREPAPILCTYMARRPPAFVRNLAGARHLNIAHGLYPRHPMGGRELDAIAAYLCRTVGLAGGRAYAGGLVKYEPGEVERLPIPEPATLLERRRG